MRIPAAPGALEARRAANDIYITLTVPSVNIDTFGPADVSRIEVYGHTGVASLPATRFLEVGALVATIPVAPATPSPAPPSKTPPLPPPGTSPVTAAGALQGTIVTSRDALDAEEMIPRTLPPPPGRPRAPVPSATVAAEGALRRFYMAIPFNMRGQPGPPSAIAEVPLTFLPEPPTELQVTSGLEAVTLRWEPSGGPLGFLLERALPMEILPRDDIAPARLASSAAPPELPGPTRYNVYRDVAPDPLALPAAEPLVVPWHAPRRVPLNPQPLQALELIDPVVIDGRQRCYHVRAVQGVAPLLVEGEASSPACVTPVDVYPPAAPTGLSALAADGVISLIWEPNVELDLGGYVVLRGEAGGATLLPLTDMPIEETRYTDRRVSPGVRYVYAVTAVDNRVPLPNVSVESARVEETAR